MKYINKWTVGSFIGVLILLGGLFSAQVFEDKIVVSLPSDVCSDATLRVTKDDFTFKCGWRIAFQADTIVEYFKTYGTDEWVRNNRYVGRNKKDIALELIEHKDYFDIIRTTKYRKGKQYKLDGVLQETYTFTKDKIKITYNYVVDNKAEHKITMRIKKQYKSFLDAFDPNGYTGIQQGNLLSYKGFGDLFIDPIITLISPANDTIDYKEGDSVPFVCYTNQSNENETIANVTLYWNASGGTMVANGTTTLGTAANYSTTFTRVIPHLNNSYNDTGTFAWTCYSCNSSGKCFFAAHNATINPIYKPHSIDGILFPFNEDLNLLNGTTAWGIEGIYKNFTNLTTNGTLYINWSYPGHPDHGGNITWNLSFYGTSNTTRRYDQFRYTTTNATTSGDWNFTNLAVDDYYISLSACTTENISSCVNDTIDVPIEIFDYTPSITTGESKIRFSTQSNVTAGPALGQTDSKGIITIDWFGYGIPTGKVNLTINNTNPSDCATIYAYTSNNITAAIALVNNESTQIFEDAASDPQYIWLWINKSGCGTTTISQSYHFGVLD